MARQQRQFMRQGVADLPNRAAVLAYAGASGEPIFDGTTLRMQDGSTPGGIPLARADTFGTLTVDQTGIMTGIGGSNTRGSNGTTLFQRPAINLADGTTLYSASNDFQSPKGLELLGSRILLNPSDRVQILPKAASYALALDVVQSGPVSGTIAGPIVLNSFDMTFSSKVTGAYGTPGLAGAGAIQGMSFGLNAGGANFDAQQCFTLAAGLTHSRSDSSTGDKGAFSAGVHTTATTNGLLDAIVASVVSDSGSFSPQIAGLEVDMAILGTGSTTNRLGVVAVNTGSKVADLADVAFAATTGGPDGTSAGGWKTLIGLYKQNPALPNVMQTTGRIFASDHDVTISDVLYGPNITVTGDILRFPQARLGSGGNLALGSTDINLFGYGRLQIEKGTTTRASILIEPGVAPSAGNVRAGQIWSDGVHLYWVKNSGVIAQLDN